MVRHAPAWPLFGAKHQITNSKFQTRSGVSVLMIGAWCLFGIWCLGFEVFFAGGEAGPGWSLAYQRARRKGFY